jgi:hypothetical protein
VSILIFRSIDNVLQGLSQEFGEGFVLEQAEGAEPTEEVAGPPNLAAAETGSVQSLLDTRSYDYQVGGVILGRAIEKAVQVSILLSLKYARG